jgi:hypothetical protein
MLIHLKMQVFTCEFGSSLWRSEYLYSVILLLFTIIPSPKISSHVSQAFVFFKFLDQVCMMQTEHNESALNDQCRVEEMKAISLFQIWKNLFHVEVWLKIYTIIIIKTHIIKRKIWSWCWVVSKSMSKFKVNRRQQKLTGWQATGNWNVLLI